MSTPAIPRATYRIQFNGDFTFADATTIIPYLYELGVSHVYASPFLKARADSPHGYDIVDHNALNPQIGAADSFAAYVETLHRHGMNQILDMVPNHMGVGGSDNRAWLDVLEHGQASLYAAYFDIDWNVPDPALRQRVLLPFLGEQYGIALERGDLGLVFDAARGAFHVQYCDHMFPLDPRSYPRVLLRTDSRALADSGRRELVAVAAAFRALPRRTATGDASRRRRAHDTAAHKARLAALCDGDSSVRAALDTTLALINGTPGDARSFNLLHRLLELQAYRLAYWRVASDEINYRRFFDINDLAAVRMEDPQVFNETHRFVLRLLADDRISGLRIDHPDGLADPAGYCSDLQHAMQTARKTGDERCYLVIEKILASHERLNTTWPVAGTTGYDAAYLINGVLVCADAERRLTRLYQRYTDQRADFDQLLYLSKRVVMQGTLASELSVLANLALRLARSDRHTRDFTWLGLRDALAELVACFPVYRTYLLGRRASSDDLRYIRWALAHARARHVPVNPQVFDFVEKLLVDPDAAGAAPAARRERNRFVLRFQQYTAPAMAKSMEDTAFYIDNRLVSLNDVGFDPRIFGISTGAFHHANQQRLKEWPGAMVSTSTHDSKRGEDTRARINVLAEIPELWSQHLARWTRLNRFRKKIVRGARMPSRNDEYLLYQTLIGTWPPGESDAGGRVAYRERIERYMLKAIREAKVHTSWINPDTEYEDAMRDFVRSLLDASPHNAFLADFLAFNDRIVRYGLLAGLSQLLIKLTVPGVPDIYQGNELWTFSLADPDNRGRVDYQTRAAALRELAARRTTDAISLTRELLEHIVDGRAKLYVTWKTLDLRRAHSDVFAAGDYLSLKAGGALAGHLIAYARRTPHRHVIVIAARWFARLCDANAWPIPDDVWTTTRIELLPEFSAPRYRNVFTDEIITPSATNGRCLDAAPLFRHFPVALLVDEPDAHERALVPGASPPVAGDASGSG